VGNFVGNGWEKNGGRKSLKERNTVGNMNMCNMGIKT